MLSLSVAWSSSRVVGYALNNRAALVIMYCITFPSRGVVDYNQVIYIIITKLR